jgi:hypothetical protein
VILSVEFESHDGRRFRAIGGGPTLQRRDRVRAREHADGPLLARDQIDELYGD